MFSDRLQRIHDLLDGSRAVSLVSKDGIPVESYENLELSQQKRLRDYYYDNIFPLVTPQTSDPAHPFPFVSNLSLNLLITYRAPGEGESCLARVKVPVGAGIPRFLKLDGEKCFVPL